jgi:glutathione peroxidase-family protein
MNRTILAFFILIFAISIHAQKAKLNDAAPEFNLKDSFGKEHSLSDFAGKVVVLEWINFECPFVKKHYNSNNMQKLQEKYAKDSIVWLALCSSAEGKQGNFSNEEINSRSIKLKAKYLAYLIDEDGKVGKMYGAKTTPHMFIVDKEGKLVYAGAIDDTPSTDIDDIETAKNYVSSALDELLDSKNVSTQSSSPYGCSVKY